MARRGELVAIERADLDLDARQLQIAKSIGYEGSALFVKGTKNEGTRMVGLDAGTVEMLRTEQPRQDGNRREVGADYEARPLDLDLVFRRDETRRLWHPNRVSQAFKREWEHAGLNPSASLHSLRHSLGSLLLGKGHPVTEVAAQLWHRDENAGMLRIALGVVFVLAGAIWILQGLNVAFAPESFMTGDSAWSWGGAAAVVVGVGLIWWGIRTQRSSK